VKCRMMRNDSFRHALAHWQAHDKFWGNALNSQHRVSLESKTMLLYSTHQTSNAEQSEMEVIKTEPAISAAITNCFAKSRTLAEATDYFHK
jgi:hypothetical protein